MLTTDKIYIVGFESNINRELPHFMRQRGKLIEAYNGLWHLSQYGGNKYELLNPMLQAEELYKTNSIIFIWHNRYILTEDIKRIIGYAKEFIVDSNKDHSSQKFRIFVANNTEFRMKEFGETINRNLQENRFITWPITDHIEFPDGMNMFEIGEDR